MYTNLRLFLLLLLLLLLIIIYYKCTVVTVFTRWRFFIYFGHLYIDHHLAIIAHIGTAMVKARGDRRDHRWSWWLITQACIIFRLNFVSYGLAIWYKIYPENNACSKFVYSVQIRPYHSNLMIYIYIYIFIYVYIYLCH